MSTSPADASSASSTGDAVAAPEGCPRLALWTLAVAAFSIGVGEFVILGFLPEGAADFAVSLPVAGWLISGYALSVAVGKKDWTGGLDKDMSPSQTPDPEVDRAPPKNLPFRWPNAGPQAHS